MAYNLNDPIIRELYRLAAGDRDVFGHAETEQFAAWLGLPSFGCAITRRTVTTCLHIAESLVLAAAVEAAAPFELYYEDGSWNAQQWLGVTSAYEASDDTPARAIVALAAAMGEASNG